MEDKMNKSILCYIPTNACNLKCEYCIVSQVDGWHDRPDVEFKYSVEHMVKALNKERLGGTCYVNLTAQGETLIYKDIVPLTRGLLEEGHYVEIVTNGTVTKRINEILEFPDDLLKHLFFKISYHYNQIKNSKAEDNYWSCVKRIKSSPCSFTIELMPHDEIVNEIETICDHCISNAGAVCHLTVGRTDNKAGKDLLTDFSKEEYEKIWSRFDSTMFKLKMDLFDVKRKEFCYAGRWSLLIDISTGEASQCYGRPKTQNIFADLSKPIKFIPVGYSCTMPYCFNGHSHVAWGIIPELRSPYYYEVRNRTSQDGTNWVKSDCAELFHQKLVDNNKEYRKMHKVLHTIANPFYIVGSLFHDIPGLKHKMIKFYKIRTGKFFREK